MTVTIDLPPDEERKLARRAAAQGQDLAGYIRTVLLQDLAAVAPSPNQATLKLLAQWDEEDATDDAAELERRRQEGEELLRSLNRNREEVGARKLFP
jgi:hypothetical protein